MLDVVMPNGNETELQEHAKKLGWQSLVFLYTNTPGKQGKTAILAQPGKVEKARNKADYVIVSSSAKDRQVIEKEKPFMILNVGEHLMEKEYAKYTQVMAKASRKNNVAWGLSLKSLLSLKGEERARLLQRWTQIARLSRKYQVTCMIVSCASTTQEMRDAHDVKALQQLLGL